MDILKSSKKRIIGYKQALKAVKNGNVQKLYLALDVEDRMKEAVIKVCRENSCEITYIKTMKELGNLCGIAVGASAVAVLSD